MNIALCYHCVPDLKTEEGESELAASRFLRTYNEYPPGYPHKLLMNTHDSPGRDIAAHQHIARTLDCDLAVFMSARVFFKTAFWLSRLVSVCRDEPADFYGMMASAEACPLYPDILPNPHIRTCFFACRPHRIVDAPKAQSPEDGYFFESRWLNRLSGGRSRLVHARQCFDLWSFREPINGFRSGDQSDLLVSDRHSAAYDAASPEEKIMLNKIANGEKV